MFAKSILLAGAFAAVFCLAGCTSANKADTLDPDDDGLNAENFGAGPGEFTQGASEESMGGANTLDGLTLVTKDLNLPIIYFGYNVDSLDASERAKLDRVAKYLEKNTSLYIIIEGHCDQRGTEEYNRALGERRANAVRQYLVQVGVPDSHLRTVSYGKDKPLAEGSGESIWKQNRRGMLIPAIKK